jgi:uncharacterized membrane protein (DUF485 family)
MKVVRLSALRTGCLYPQETFLVLIRIMLILCVVLCIFVFYVLFVLWRSLYCVYMCTELLPPGGYPIAVKYIVSKNPMTRSGIEPATFRFVVQCLNQQRHRVPQRTGTKGKYFALENKLLCGCVCVCVYVREYLLCVSGFGVCRNSGLAIRIYREH